MHQVEKQVASLLLYFQTYNYTMILWFFILKIFGFFFQGLKVVSLLQLFHTLPHLFTITNHSLLIIRLCLSFHKVQAFLSQLVCQDCGFSSVCLRRNQSQQCKKYNSSKKNWHRIQNKYMAILFKWQTFMSSDYMSGTMTNTSDGLPDLTVPQFCLYNWG